MHYNYRTFTDDGKALSTITWSEEKKEKKYKKSKSEKVKKILAPTFTSPEKSEDERV